MKKLNLNPLLLSGMVMTLVACGGESGNFINENEADGVTISTSCNASSDNCLGFVLDYPVAGINFNCSSDNVNNFTTVLASNAVTGACRLGDNVRFSIQGRNTNNKLDLGELDLDSISVIKIRDAQSRDVPVPLSIIDMARAINNNTPIANLNDRNDNTVKVAVALIRIFQAIGIRQVQNVAGDIQPISLSEDFKIGLSNATTSVGLNDYISGNYASIIRNWVDVSTVSEDQAYDVLLKLANQSTTGIYVADILPFSSTTLANINSLISISGLEGFRGRATSGNTRRELIGNMYTLTDRAGFGFGYGMQWKGEPLDTTNTVPGSGGLIRINLLAEVQPVKMTAITQKNWLDPIAKRINPSAPFRFNVADDINNPAVLRINQGKLLNGVIMVSNETSYKLTTKTNVGVPADYTLWSQTGSTGDYTGTMEISKINPVTFLDRRTFKTFNNSFAGERYLFPLYADITFSFKQNPRSTPTPVTLGIAIDENGDIRTNFGATPNAADPDNLSSRNTCNTVDANMMGSNNVQQYRIGTLGAANFTDNDKSVTLRMILADPVFGKLEGLIAGINQNLTVVGVNDNNVNIAGVKLNVSNLLAGSSEGDLVTITNFTNTSAQWVNIFAAYQLVYNTAAAGSNGKLTAPTAEQEDLAKRVEGTITRVSLPDCYRLNLRNMVKPPLTLR